MVQSKASRGSRADSGASAGSGKDRQSVRDSRKRGAGASPPPAHPPPRKAARGAASASAAAAAPSAAAATRETRQASRSEQKSSAPSPPATSGKRHAKKPSPSGLEAVNRRLKVYWPGRKLWQDGVVTAYNDQEDTHFVKYDTGEEQWVTLRAKEDNRRLKWVESPEQSPVSQPQAASPAPDAAGEDDAADKGDAEEQQQQQQQQRPHHRRSRSGSSALGSGGAAQPRSSSRVAKRSLKRQAQLEEEQQQRRPDGGAAGEEQVQGSGRGGSAAPSNGHGKSSAAAEEGSSDSEGDDRKEEGSDPQVSKAEEEQSPPTAPKSAAGTEEGGAPEKQPDLGEGPSDPAAAAAAPAPATSDQPLRNAKGELLSPSGETEKELRARAEIAWLRTYEALNKAVRLVKLAREGVRGDAVVPNGNIRPGDPIRSPPPSADRSPLMSPTSGARKISARPRKSSEKGEALSLTQNPQDAALRARISVFWPGNGRYYKALVTGYNREKDQHCIEYDDGEEEWLNLSEEYFKWLGPRSRSAGYSQAQCAAVMSLNPEDIVPPTAELLGASINAAETDGPSGEQAVGWRLAILWEADGSFSEAEILSFKNNKHHVLYADGEDEWVQLSKELKVWRQKGRGASKPAGLGPGVEAPRGRAAIGWRVGVYWKEDTVFYPGEIRGYDSATGKHHIHYDDNEDEFISLSTEKIKWVVPPDMPERTPALRKRFKATSGRPSKKAALTQGGTSEGDGAPGGDYSEAAAPADFPNHSSAADPGQWQPQGTAAPAGSSRDPSGKGKGLASPSLEGPSTQGGPVQRISGVAVPPPVGSAAPGAAAAAALPAKAKRPAPVKLPEGAVCRRIRRAALGTTQGCIGSGSIASRLASLLLPQQQQQQDKAAAATAAAASGASEAFEEFLQVCVLDASKAAPFPSAGAADSGSDGTLSRVSVLSRMLARVGAGQESLKQGLPPGARPCRHAGEQLGKKPPPQVVSQPQSKLQSIRVSIPKPQQLPQKTPSAVHQPKQEEEALVSPFQTPLGGLPRSLSGLNIPTPTAFTLDASPHHEIPQAPGSAAPPLPHQQPPQLRCAVKTLPSAAATAPAPGQGEGVPPH